MGEAESMLLRAEAKLVRAALRVGMGLYGLLLAGVLVVGAPYWLVRMAGSGRYRAGLWGRLGRVPAGLREAVAGKRVVWVHAVSVGEVLAATQLVRELEAALAAERGGAWVICISTTTATGQALAKERFGSERVFWYPLDFGWAVGAYLRALRPEMVVLLESELWPRMLYACGRAGVPVAVVNARVSDRSYARGLKVKAVWGRVLRGVGLFLAQSEEDGRRLVAMGAGVGAVRVVGNLKYDVRASRESWVAELIQREAAGRPIVVAGSTVAFRDGYEDLIVLAAWRGQVRTDLNALLVVAPRHPSEFGHVLHRAHEYRTFSAANDLCLGARSKNAFSTSVEGGDGLPVEVVVLDTIGDLAAVYGVADVAFVGGSLVKRGGHNPLEPAQFGVPVVMGTSYENFRGIVGEMMRADAIRIVKDEEELEGAFAELLANRDAAKAMGERGRRVFEEQQGATGRAVAALVGLVKG